MRKRRGRAPLVAVALLVVGVLPGATWAADDAGAKGTFKDEPAAHAIYDRTLDTFRKADAFHCRSTYTWDSAGLRLGEGTYEMWLQKPNYVRVEAIGGPITAILVGDGETFWTSWPKGRPKWSFEESADRAKEYERTRSTSYMKLRSSPGYDSLAHMFPNLGVGMCMPVINPSVFHGCTDSMEGYLDGVRSLGAEVVNGEQCDGIEVSYMDHQRSRLLWLSKTDYLPRRLEEIIRVGRETRTREAWSDVALNQPLLKERFQWSPPGDWAEFQFPKFEEGLLAVGAQAPDFNLPTLDGGRFKLSDQRNKVVWVCFWRVGCPPCREELPELQKLYIQHRDKGLVVMGFNCSDQKDIAQQLLTEKGVTFPSIVETAKAAQNVSFQQYQTLGGMSAVPLNYIIGRDGKVAAAWYGYSNEDTKPAALLEQLGIK